MARNDVGTTVRGMKPFVFRKGLDDILLAFSHSLHIVILTTALCLVVGNSVSFITELPHIHVGVVRPDFAHSNLWARVIDFRLNLCVAACISQHRATRDVPPDLPRKERARDYQ